MEYIISKLNEYWSAKRVLFSFCIFSIVFLIYFKSPVVTPYDSKFTIPSALSMIIEHNTDLNEYENIDKTDYAMECIDGKYYNRYPIGASILSLPITYIAYKMYDYEYLKRYDFRIEFLNACFFASLCVLAFFFICTKYLSVSRSLILSLIFAFGTSLYSTASRAMWQHGPLMLMILLVILILIRNRQKPKWIPLAALPLAFAYVCRPAASIFILVMCVYIFIAHRNQFLKFLAVSVCVAIPFLLYNYLTRHSILPSYYDAKAMRIGQSQNLFDGFLGIFFSPSRGLFVFSPILLLSFMGIFYSIKDKKEQLAIPLAIVLFFNILLLGSVPYWWGGWSYGPRLMSDYLPVWMFFLIPIIQRIPEKLFYTFSDTRTIFVYLTVAFSIFTHTLGAISFEGMWWNGRPNNIDENYYRLWDIQDPQFLRGTFLSGYKPYNLQEKIGKLSTYSLGDTLSFKDSDKVFYGKGWASEEDIHRWSDGDNSNIYFRIGDVDPSKKYKIGICAGTFETQSFDVYINNEKIGDFWAKKEERKVFELPILASCLMKNNINVVTIKSSTPLQSGGTDRRFIAMFYMYMFLKQE